MRQSKPVDDYPPDIWLLGATREDIKAGMHPVKATQKALAIWREQGELAKKFEAERAAKRAR